MEDFRNDKDNNILNNMSDWSGSNRALANQAGLNMDWSRLNSSSQATDQLTELSGNSSAVGSRYAHLGIAVDQLHLDAPQLNPNPMQNTRQIPAGRQLLRFSSDMTASRRDRNRDNLVSTFQHNFEAPAQFAASQQEEKVDLTRSQYEKLKQTIKLLSDQIKDIHEVLQKLMPVLKKLLSSPKDEVSAETVQGMLDQLLPRIEENLSQHLHNVQNKVLNNIHTSMENQESKYQQLCQQVTFLNGGLARRDQEVLEMLGQLSEVITTKETQFDTKMEEMKQEMNKRLEAMEARLVHHASGEGSNVEGSSEG
eukprot:TRINITY_DN59276_c0_g1_i4.p1 TRINITY_DN59276_c0_g1~~TRINITY_DN59276_c0_g1_i4.p1  ORF type:complete len:310 (-),score=37.11 TRINITY_DN59276_c0_g1_i4:1176-2105(-)